jgi:hypothetical protein
MKPTASIVPWVRHPVLALALTTFAILVLELAMIRWLTTQIRIAAYFANLVMLAAFLGMGLGVGLGRHSARLARWTLPALALVCVFLACAGPLGLVHVTFPDLAPTDWGTSSGAGGTWLQFVGSASLVTACFWAIVVVFLLPGTLVGALFGTMPPLQAYGADLSGSLAGVLVMALIAALSSPPPVWIALGALPLLWLVRDRWSVLATVVAVAAAAYSIDGARFSPYNRIDLIPGLEQLYGTPPSGAKEWSLRANRDYYQRMLDLRPAAGETPERRFVREVYELPFSFSDRPGRSAVVVGAGTGNDVAAALRRGFSRVVSIDIDPAILQAGVELHPEKPYADPRAVRINDDARAYFGRDDGERFDVVCYGLLDSHAMFSSMSSLRLDNFVYTREGLAAAWSRVADDGVLSVSLSVFASDWMYKRMVGLIREATGLDPIIVAHGYDAAATFLVGRHLSLAEVRKHADARREPAKLDGTAVPSDDWPFLYLRMAGIPWTYLTVFILVGLTATLAVRGVFGASVFSRGRFDVQMFLLGAAFMLLETRAVTQLSLLFGSTWIVNASVFGGVLLMVLAANMLASRLAAYRRPLWYLLLAVSLVVLWMLPTQAFFTLPLWARAAAAGPIVAVPVFFAGVIFSSELRSRADAAAALGCNLCGAMLGGLLENLSMLVGLKAIVLLALAIYLGSLHAALRAHTSMATARS